MCGGVDSIKSSFLEPPLGHRLPSSCNVPPSPGWVREGFYAEPLSDHQAIPPWSAPFQTVPSRTTRDDTVAHNGGRRPTIPPFSAPAQSSSMATVQQPNDKEPRSGWADDSEDMHPIPQQAPASFARLSGSTSTARRHDATEDTGHSRLCTHQRRSTAPADGNLTEAGNDRQFDRSTLRSSDLR